MRSIFPVCLLLMHVDITTFLRVKLFNPDLHQFQLFDIKDLVLEPFESMAMKYALQSYQTFGGYLF